MIPLTVVLVVSSFFAIIYVANLLIELLNNHLGTSLFAHMDSF